MSEAAAPLGFRLKAERERKGFSAQKAADELHLDAWVIEALESGDYARLGPAVYGKGHLKRYAGLLGLPADEILGAYDSRSGAPALPAQTSSLRMLASDPVDMRRLPWAFIAGGLAVVCVVAGVLWWRPWQPRIAAVPPATHSISEPAASAASTAVETIPPAVSGREGNAAERGPADRVSDGDSRAVVTAVGSPARTAAVTASGAEPTDGLGPARLRLSFSADSWVDVHDAKGRRLYAGQGRANSVKTIAGTAPLRVYLGFASGVQLEVNNQVVAIGPQFVAGDVARFEAGADGVLRRDVHASAAGKPRPRG